NFAEYKNATPVNWQKEVMGNKGHTIQQNLSLSGGTKKLSYTASYTYQDDKAIVLSSAYKRHQGNAKFEYKINSKMKVGVSGRYTNQNVYGAGTSETGAAFNRLRQSVRYQPFILPGQAIDQVDPDEDPGGPGLNLSLINPIKLNQQEYKRKTTNAYNITASFTYNINKHWTFKSTFGIDNSLLETRSFNDSITSFSTVQNGRKPIISFDSLRKKSWVNSNVLTYSLKNYKKKHDIEVLLGQEWRQAKTMSVNHQSREIERFANRDSLFAVYNTLKEHTGFGIPNQYNESGASFFTRIGYTYNKKYIFNFVLRADGSSKFLDENKWGFFPSASVAWRASQEKFFDNVKFFDDVKFRAGFGANGNSRIGDYLYSSVFNPNDFFYGLNNTAVNAFSIAQLANQRIKWESVVNRNIGLDLVFLKKRVELSVDYYYNTSKDLLLNTKIAPTFGFTEQIQNIGKTKNTGVELQLNAVILQSKKGLNWNANFNMSFNKNEVVELSYGNQTYPVDPSWFSTGYRDYMVRVGEPLGQIYGFETDGFYKVEDFNFNTSTQTYTLKPGVVVNTALGTTIQPGSIKFKDLNGNDSVLNNDSDRKIIGNTNPKFTGGLNQQFTYKNFDASIFLNFSYGNDVYNANKIEFTNGYVNYANLSDVMSNRWRTVNDQGVVVKDPVELAALNANANIWRPSTAGNAAFHTHSWAIEDGSFLRINNVTIGYSLPLKALVKLGISRLRVYVTGNNLAVFSKYSGYDPEVSVRRSGLTPGLDYSAYPRSRSFIFGLNVNF
ncbi:MAG: SusC/RagA family TonB-linked outer membrane protein, partial [Chitinophagaceae bacterium]